MCEPLGPPIASAAVLRPPSNAAARATDERVLFIFFSFITINRFIAVILVNISNVKITLLL